MLSLGNFYTRYLICAGHLRVLCGVEVEGIREGPIKSAVIQMSLDAWSKRMQRPS